MKQFLRRNWIWFAATALTAFLVFAAIHDESHRGLSPRYGIRNFGQITSGIYRGAQPDAAAVHNLHELGIKSIIDLRMPNEVFPEEATSARAEGIVYTNMPLPDFSRPSAERIHDILVLMQSLPRPVFVHCQHGCDRTGTVIACYRIQNDHWSVDRALAEARVYGLSIFEQGMRGYVKQFSKQNLRAAELR